MIKKILFLVVTGIIYFSGYAQSNSECVEDFSFNTETIAGNHPVVDDIIISWDFSETENKEHLELLLEIQPLDACWKGLDGTNRSDLKKIKITNFSENTIGQQKLEFADLNCKCIKWKAIIVDPINNCETITKWKFTSFL